MNTKLVIEKAEELARGILDTSEIFRYNPNGPDAYVCPFCGAENYPSGGRQSEPCEKDCLRNKAYKFLYEIVGDSNEVTITDKTRYIPISKVRGLHECIDFLDSFDDEDAVIGESLESPDIEKSRMIRELASLNKRRKELINQIISGE